MALTATYGNRYVFAPLDYSELGLETRLTTAFSPTLSLELYAQPLLSSGDYGDAIYLTAADSYDFAPHDVATEAFHFNLRSLRGNAVLRWEWRRGSTLYLAWQQARQDHLGGVDGDTGFDLGRDQRALWGAEPDNIFVLKMNYWLNP